MSYWILPKSKVVHSYATVWHVTKEDYANPGQGDYIEEFYVTIKERVNDDNFELQPEYSTTFM